MFTFREAFLTTTDNTLYKLLIPDQALRNYSFEDCKAANILLPLSKLPAPVSDIVPNPQGIFFRCSNKLLFLQIEPSTENLHVPTVTQFYFRASASPPLPVPPEFFPSTNGTFFYFSNKLLFLNPGVICLFSLTHEVHPLSHQLQFIATLTYSSVEFPSPPVINSETPIDCTPHKCLLSPAYRSEDISFDRETGTFSIRNDKILTLFNIGTLPLSYRCPVLAAVPYTIFRKRPQLKLNNFRWFGPGQTCPVLAVSVPETGSVTGRGGPERA